MNILIRGGGFVNKGAEAMICTVQRDLSIRLKNANFYILCPENNEQYAYTSGITPILPFESRMEKFIGGRVARILKTYSCMIKMTEAGLCT